MVDSILKDEKQYMKKTSSDASKIDNSSDIEDDE